LTLDIAGESRTKGTEKVQQLCVLNIGRTGQILDCSGTGMNSEVEANINRRI
jgi:hypothetical protein